MESRGVEKWDNGELLLHFMLRSFPPKVEWCWVVCFEMKIGGGNIWERGFFGSFSYSFYDICYLHVRNMAPILSYPGLDEC